MRTRSPLLLLTLLVAGCFEEAPTPADAAPDAADVHATDVGPDVVAADLTLADVQRPDATAGDAASPGDAPAFDAPSPDAGAADVTAADVAWREDASAEECASVGGASCFAAPAGTVRTNRGILDFSCTETPAAVTTMPSTVRVGVQDFATRAGVDGATVALSPDDTFTSLTSIITADGFGRLDAPIGTPSRAFWRVTREGFLPTYSTSARLDVALGTNTQSLLAVTPGIVAFVRGQVRAGAPVDGTGVLASAIDDCDGHPMENVVVTLSSASSTIPGDATRFHAPAFVPGARVFYFNGDEAPLPAPRTSRQSTGPNGIVVLLDVPPTEGATRWFLQAWGYRTEGALRLMGETPVRSIAGAVVLPEMQAWR